MALKGVVQLSEFFRKLFSSDFMPHGGCYFWRPEILWLHACSDVLIALSYFLIPFSLILLVRKRKDLEFDWMFVMFGVFILSCGLTHVMNTWNIWHSTYRLEGVLKAITALVSLPTALLMFRLVPRARALPSPADLRREIEDRKRAENEARTLNAELERRVEERTLLLRRSNEALQRFVYIASHDLQEPVRTVKSMNQLLARDYRGRLGERGDQYIGFVLEASDRMQTLVSDLLTFSQTVDQEVGRHVAASNASDAVQAVIADLSNTIEESGAHIAVGDLPSVQADATRLQQVFQNLITNAIKYSKPGEPPEIEIAAERRDDFCLFSVRDRGAGFEPQYAEQIFVAFKRLHGREHPGSGVGLTICKNIVEECGGRIWAKSQPGEGSTFYFTLPLAEIVTTGTGKAILMEKNDVR